MSIYTFFLIFLWSFVGLFIVASFILTYFYGRSTVKDNPSRAMIFIKTGKHISKPIRGFLTGKSSQKGCRYNYKDSTIFIPASYGDYFYNNKRMLFINHIGQLVASPFGDDIPLSDTEKEELIYEFVSSHIGADAVKALKGKQTVPIIIVAIVAFIIGIVAVFGYMYMSDMMLQQGVVKEQPVKPPIEIKPAP